ncbi:CaiB/BaiF CoA transferase family protein [Frankia canadensis]|uniref:CaiB/BaiF CoA transferase family protein n=1 Tax=Frankia canadensis TaxID=1836972 RepID=UPI001A9C765E|nr:CoA transferase [Frankia canadensis]
MEPSDENATALPGSLTGIRVVEIGDQQGEYTGLSLAGLGAQVVRVEPPGGAPTRRLAPFAGDVPDPERSLHFWAYNRGKKSVVLDLDTDDGLAAFTRLLATADVLIDSTPHRHLAERGLTDLEERFPRLITARITPFGEDGPWAGYRGSDLVHLALGGPLLNCGYDPLPDGQYDLPPMAPQLYHAFHIAGEHVTFGVLAALVRRQSSGRGQRLTCAVHEAVSKNTETDLMAWVVQRQPYYRQTARHAGAKVGQDLTIAHTKDGRWLNVISIGARDRNLMKPFLDKYGMGDAITEEKVEAEVGARHIPGTTQSASANVEIIQRLVRRFTFAELPWQEMQAAGLLCAPVRRPEENATDPHWLTRGTFVAVEHPEDGRSYVYPASKWIATGSRWDAGRRAPRVGEDTADVLASWPGTSAASGSATATARIGDIDERLSVHKKPFALPGTKIFDFTWFLASAGGTRFLAALGADVIKVEWKAHPDTRGGGFPAGGREARRAATTPLVAPPTGPMGGQFNNKNPGKRGISLNVRHPKGREIALEFLRRSDVVAEGFSPGVFERWGLGWDALREINPSIIYAQQSGMGAKGTYGRFRAVGPIAGSLSGLTHLGGLPEPALPTGWGYSYLDWLGAYSFAAAILAALYQRGETGQAQWVDASQAEVGIFTTAVPVLDWSVNGRSTARFGNRAPYGNFAPQGVYRCAGEDRWLAITCLDDRDWRVLAGIVGPAGWADDPRLSTVAGRVAHHDEIDRRISVWAATRDRYAAMEELQRAGIAAGAAQTAEDRCDIDPQLSHLKWLTEVPNPSVGTWPVAEVPFDLSETPPHAGGWIDKGAPVYGEHNYEVYGEVLGLSCAEVDALAEEGVV